MLKRLWIYAMISLIFLFASVPLSCAHAETIRADDVPDWSAQAILVDGNTVHVVASYTKGITGSTLCYQLDANNVLTRCEKMCCHTPEPHFNNVSITLATPSGFTFAIVGMKDVFRWTPDEEEPWTYLFSDEQIEEVYHSSLDEGGALVQYAASDQAIYECSRDATYTWHIARYDVQTGERKEIYKRQGGLTPCIAAMPEDALALAFPGEPILRVAPDGETEKLAMPRIREEYEGMVYVEGKGFLFITREGVYQVSDQGKTTFLNYAPPHKSILSYAQGLFYLPERDELAFLGMLEESSALFTVPLQPQEVTALQLGGYPTDFLFTTDYKFAFETEHANVRVQTAASYVSNSFDDVAKQMTVQDPNCDLYLLRTDDGGLDNMVRKGYFVPLDDVPELTQFAEALYPAWKNEVTAKDGTLAALPVWVDSYTAVTYNREVWEREELGEMPTTYAGLLDCIQRWSDEGILGQMRLFDGESGMAVMTDLLLRASIAHDDSRGQAPTFTNETLLSLLRRVSQMRLLFAVNDQRKVYENTLMHTSRSVRPESVDMAPEALLYLGFENEEDVHLSRTLYAYIINPYSKHQEEAKAYLTTITQMMEDETRFALQDTGEDGVVNRRNLEQKASLTEGYNEMRTSYDDLLADHWSKDFLDNRLLEYQQWIAELENNRYSITPEAAEAYRRTMRQGAVNRESGMALIYDNASSTISAFIDGKISPEELCRKLDEVVRMWVMENE